MSNYIDHWLDELDDKQKVVVERRFGLHGFDRCTLDVVGKDLGVTRERVRQIQMESLRKLRKILESEGFSADTLFR